jgi:flagellar hook protein FlgE
VKKPSLHELEDSGSELGDIIIPVGGKDPANATTLVKYRSNLDTETPLLPIDREATVEEILNGTVATNIDIYDSLGNIHALTLDFTRVQDEENTWLVTARVEDADPATLSFDTEGTNLNNTASIIMRFDNAGAVVSIEDNPLTPGAPVDIVNEGQLVAALNVTFPAEGIVQTINLDFGTAASYEGITQFAAPSSTRAFEQDGYGLGFLESFTIDNSGVITGVYTNGKKAPIAQVALASFTNPQGLTVEGDNTFRQTNNSGLANIGAAETGGRGKITAGALEMSNVDLAEQFTDMIVTQRGFQANSRSITTSDQMLQELLTLKR